MAATDISSLSHADLVARILAVQKQLQEARAKIVELLAKIEALERAGHRQATPFAKGKPKSDPKKPGRKRGEGKFTHREAPGPGEFTKPIVDVPVKETRCPHCGGVLGPVETYLASNTDIPEDVRPDVRGYRVQVSKCTNCGKAVRGKHPDLKPDQYGATAHRVGEMAFALAAAMHFDVGVPQRKVPDILKLFGLLVTQSTLTQRFLRQSAPACASKPAGPVQAAYQQLCVQVKDQPTVNTDDTGWKVAGKTAYLMAFVTWLGTVYQIRERHRNEEVREIIPADYAGTMGCDCGSSYNARELVGVKQQKCLSHIQCDLSELLERSEGDATEFPSQLKTALHDAIEFWKSHRALPVPEYQALAGEVKGRLAGLLKDRDLPDPANQRMLYRLGTLFEQGKLTRFLDDPRVEPTNNSAERALRPAVISRKVSHCSNRWTGAHAHEAFMSVVRTIRQHSPASLPNELCRVMQTGRVQCASP